MTFLEKNQRPFAGGDGISVSHAQFLFNDGYPAVRLYNPPFPPANLSTEEKNIWWDGVEAAHMDRGASDE